MKYVYKYSVPIALLFLLGIFLFLFNTKKSEQFYSASDARLNYIGRFDFSNKALPKCWASGATVQFSFKGSDCVVVIEDESYFGPHNYVEIILDGKYTKRIKLKSKTNRIVVAKNVSENQVHEVKICKGTEAKIGYIGFKGVYCEKLLNSSIQTKLVEFIGDSITCGTGSYMLVSPCGTNEWYDQHSAYFSYGPSVCRKLKADWVLTSVSGFGLVRSCCGNENTLPKVKDYIDLSFCSKKIDCSNLRLPDLECICLGQNDGLAPQDKMKEAYIELIEDECRTKKVKKFICIVSPMANDRLKEHLYSVLNAVKSYFQERNELDVEVFKFSKRYASGCDTHPTRHEHQLMANELYLVANSMMNK